MQRARLAVKALLALDVCLAIAMLIGGGRQGTNDHPYKRSGGYECYKPKRPAKPMPASWAPVYIDGED